MSGDATQLGYRLTQEDHARIQPKLFAKIRRLGFSAEDAEDLVQEAFLQAHRALSLKKFDGRSALDTWVVGIAKNLCLKKRKTRGAAKRTGHEVSLDQPRDDTPGALQPIDDKVSPEAKTADRQALGSIMRSLRALPAKIREPLVLFANGHSYKEIAAMLRISPDLVTSRVQQARAKLRKAIPRPPRG